MYIGNGRWIDDSGIQEIAAHKRAVLNRLAKMEALLSEPGRWIKGDYKKKYKDGTVQYCAMGALYAVSKGRGYTGAHTALTVALPRHAYSVISFNDEPTTRRRDVIALIKRATKFVEDL